MKFLIYNGNIQLRIEIDKIQWYLYRGNNWLQQQKYHWKLEKKRSNGISQVFLNEFSEKGAVEKQI